MATYHQQDTSSVPRDSRDGMWYTNWDNDTPNISVEIGTVTDVSEAKCAIRRLMREFEIRVWEIEEDE